MSVVEQDAIRISFSWIHSCIIVNFTVLIATALTFEDLLSSGQWNHFQLHSSNVKQACRARPFAGLFFLTRIIF